MSSAPAANGPARASSFSHRTPLGLRLHVHRFRDEAVSARGITVLLLHGLLDAGATWDLVAEPLAREGFDVVAPDLRGFGQSEHVGPGGYYHFPDYVADVASLVDALAPARLAVVGHSMGGTIASSYTGAFPERVERLVLLEGAGPPAMEPSLAVDRTLAWLRDLATVARAPRALASLDEAVTRLAQNHPRVPREVLASRAPLLTRTDAEGRLVWAFDPLHRTTSPTPFSVEGFKAFLARIRCPTLFVGGGPHGWHPPDEGERLACIASCRTAEIAGAGHMMHWTAPAEVARLVTEHVLSP